mmetsp:Transcript_29164/g.50993  ORF Transcript_29164/g.50993 Transcript_29164/m.50993 type:complete len:252 (+) Transcript_29164:70-825(+)
MFSPWSSFPQPFRPALAAALCASLALPSLADRAVDEGIAAEGHTLSPSGQQSEANTASLKGVGSHTKEFGETIAELVKRVNDKIDSALTVSANTALSKSQEYQTSIEDLEKGLTEFGKSANILKADLSKEHQDKVRMMGEDMQRGLDAAPPREGGSSSLASLDQIAFRGGPPPASLLTQQALAESLQIRDAVGGHSSALTEDYLHGQPMPRGVAPASFGQNADLSDPPLDEEMGGVGGEESPYIGPDDRLD